MNLRPTLLLGLLCSMPVQAELVCDGCVFDYTTSSGTYLGGYWPGDRGTFKAQTVFTTPVIGFWVIDLNANGTLVFTASTPVASFTEHFRAELYPEWGGFSDCDWTPGGVCMGVAFFPEIIACTLIPIGDDQCQIALDVATVEGEKRWTLKAPGLVAGRYVLRVIGQKGTTAKASYTGKVALR